MNNFVKHLIFVGIGIVVFDIGRRAGYEACKLKTVCLLMEEDKPTTKAKIIKKTQDIK